VTVRCPKCQHENPDDTLFCGKCGTQFPSPEEVKVTQTIETPREELSTGSTFAGRYQIIEELGKGGMGKVYKAHDMEIKEKIALKLIKPEISADKNTIERFQNELKFARKISHRNVCRMYDLNKEKASYYITMEYVSGEDLKSFIRRSRRLDIGTAVSIAKEVCEGLSEAHRLGVIHRDLKPSNIMIDRDGNVRIMDFGIARSTTGKGLTDKGVMIGTPEYMSPEQVEGKEIDQRTDIYSLGIILYEMLTGRLPFEGDTALTVAVKHKTEAPKSPKEYNEQISEDLNRLILKCLEKDKEKRYQNAGELRSELDSIERGIHTTDRVIPERKPLTSREITVTFGFKKLLVPALVFIGIVIIGVVIWQLLPEKEAVVAPKIQNSLAVISFKNQTGDKSYDYLQEAIPNLLTTNLENTGFLHVATWERMQDLLKRIGRQNVEVIDSELGFKLCRIEGIESLVLGSFVKAGETFVTDIKVLDVDSKKLVKSANAKGKGVDSILDSQIDELSREISLGIGVARQKIEETKLKVAEVTTSSMEAYKHYLVGVKLFWEDKEAEGVKSLEMAVAIDPSFASAYRYLGWTYYFLGNAKAGEEAYEKAKALSSKATEKERLLIEAYTESNSDKKFNKYQEIIQKYPKEKEAYFQIGNQYNLVKKMPDEAIPFFNKTIELDPSFGYAYFNLSGIYAEKGNYQKAMECLKRYEAIKPNAPSLLLNIAWLYWRMGQQEEALEKDKEILRIDPGNLFALEDLAINYAYREEYTETMKWLNEFVNQAPQNKKARGYLLKAFIFYWLGDTGNYRNFSNEAQISAEESADDYAKMALEWLNGFSYSDQGEFDKATEEFRLMQDLSVKTWPQYTAFFKSWVSSALGLIELKHGETEAAKSALIEMDAQLNKIEAGQKGWHAYFHDFLAAEIQIAEHSPEKAISILEKASLREYIGEMPHIWIVYHNIPLYKDGLARAYKQMGNLDKAISEYKKLMTYDPKKKDNFLIHPKYHYRLAKLYEEKSMKDKSREEYQKFLDLWKDADPGLAEVVDARERLAALKEEEGQ